MAPIPRSGGQRPAIPRGDRKNPEQETAAAWAFLWVLFGFKMATVFLIYWGAQSFEAGALLTATTWFWFGLPIAAAAAPLLFRYRLIRVRARRERLRRAEWLLDQDVSQEPNPLPTGTRR